MRTQIIVAMSGRKNAGKNTIATFIAKHYIQEFANTDDFITENPECLHPKLGHKLLDEYVFECSFADQLKEFCINTLGLRREQCYGTDDEKNSLTQYKWEDAPDILRWKFGGNTVAEHLVAKGASSNEIAQIFYQCSAPNCCPAGTGFDRFPLATGYMTGREVMQIVGTDLMRQTFGNVWAAATIRTIKRHEKPMNIVTDNRFPDEIKAVLAEPKGYIIRLTRSPFGTVDVHPSESALDDYDWDKEHCYILDNADMTIDEQNDAVVPILNEILN